MINAISRKDRLEFKIPKGTTPEFELMQILAELHVEYKGELTWSQFDSIATWYKGYVFNNKV